MKEHKLLEKYNPKNFENVLYTFWEEKGFFKPNMDKTKEAYSIMMPPPNVTRKTSYGSCFRWNYSRCINKIQKNERI